MVRTITVIIFFLFASLIACQGANTPMTDAERSAIEEKIIAKLAEISEASSRLDADGVYSHFVNNDRGILAFDGTLILSRDAALNLSREIYSSFKDIKKEMVEEYVTVISPETAILTGTGTSTLISKSGDSVSGTFAFSIVFVLRDGEWKAIHIHESTPSEFSQ